MKKLFIAVAAISVIIALVMLTALSTGQTNNAMTSYNFDEMDLIQLEKPKHGQMMAVIDTTEGVIKAVLYPEYAPNTVDNFVKSQFSIVITPPKMIQPSNTRENATISHLFIFWFITVPPSR